MTDRLLSRAEHDAAKAFDPTQGTDATPDMVAFHEESVKRLKDLDRYTTDHDFIQRQIAYHEEMIGKIKAGTLMARRKVSKHGW